MSDVLAKAYIQWAESQLSTEKVKARLECVPLAGAGWMLRIELRPCLPIGGISGDERIPVQDFAQWTLVLMAWRREAHLPANTVVCLAPVLLVLADNALAERTGTFTTTTAGGSTTIAGTSLIYQQPAGPFA